MIIPKKWYILCSYGPDIKKNHFGNEEGTLVSKYTKALVRLYSSDCQLQGLGEWEPHPEKQTYVYYLMN